MIHSPYCMHDFTAGSTLPFPAIDTHSSCTCSRISPCSTPPSVDVPLHSGSQMLSQDHVMNAHGTSPNSAERTLTAPGSCRFVFHRHCRHGPLNPTRIGP